MAKELWEGNQAIAEAAIRGGVEAFFGYPITPQTELMHKFAQFYADGLVNTELVLVESEHSAMSAAVGAFSPASGVPSPVNTRVEVMPGPVTPGVA